MTMSRLAAVRPVAPFAVLAIALSAAFAAPTEAQTTSGLSSAQSTAAPPSDDKVARGKYIVSTSGCHDCHTPWKVGPNGPEPDMTRALSGHPQDMKLSPPPVVPEPWVMVAAATNTAYAGPWGISYTANLTPDAETGIGKWTLRNFVDTIRSGRHLGRGRDVLPPMPVQVYRNWTDADFEAVYSYLRTVPAIKNQVPEPVAPAAPSR
jgi:mono/diheme cytochrome c family protein